MALSGMGFTRASCSAYRNKNGVTTPVVSAGSNHVGAIPTWTAHVICPVGAPCWAMATWRRGQPCQVVKPARPPSVPWSTRRRVSAVSPCGALDMIAPPVDAIVGVVERWTVALLDTRPGPLPNGCGHARDLRTILTGPAYHLNRTSSEGPARAAW